MHQGISIWLAIVLCACGAQDISGQKTEMVDKSSHADRKILYGDQPDMTPASRDAIERLLISKSIEPSSDVSPVQNDVEIFRRDGSYERSTDGFSITGHYTVQRGSYCTIISENTQCIRVFNDKNGEFYRLYAGPRKIFYLINR